MSDIILRGKEPGARIQEILQACLEEGDTLKVRQQDQATPPFQYYLMRHLNENVKLASNIEMNDEEITLVSGHGFVIGDYISIWEGGRHLQERVMNVVGDVITLPIPCDTNYTTNARIIRGSINMAIDASAGIEFKIKPITEDPIDIATIKISFQSGATVPDDGTFGGMAALTDGCYFRAINGMTYNLGNYRTNQDFIDKGAVVTYSDKAPAGTNGTRVYFDMRGVFGIVFRTGMTTGDELIFKLRGDLTDLNNMTVSLLGQGTLGE